MRQISNFQFLISNYFLSFLLSFYFLLFAFCFPVFSQSPSPTATDSGKFLDKPIQVLGEQATNEGVLSNTVNDKLEDLKKEIASKAAILKNEVNKKIENKAVLGHATVITTDTMTLETKNGNRTIKMNEYTLFQDNSKQKSKKGLIKEGLSSADTLVCLGDMDEKGIMVAKKIVKIDPVVESENKYLFGQIRSVNNLSFILELKNVKGSQNSMINFSGTTVVQNGKSEGNINDIKQAKPAIVIGKPKGDQIQASFVYLIPNAALGKNNNSASSAANQSN